MPTMSETLRLRAEKDKHRLRQLERQTGLAYAVLWRFIAKERYILSDTADRLAAHYGMVLISAAHLEAVERKLCEVTGLSLTSALSAPSAGQTSPAQPNVRTKPRSEMSAGKSPSNIHSTAHAGVPSQRKKCTQCRARGSMCPFCLICPRCGANQT
jgi:hypothetical protein